MISTSDEVTIANPTVTKSGDSDGGDSCNFYGLNAAVLVKDGSSTTIIGGTVTSDADGANGVFSYGGNGGQNGADGYGTTVTIRDTKIVTTGDGSGGIPNAKGETVSAEVGTVSVTLDSTSTWTLTGDSYVTEFNGDAANVTNNGYTLYVNGTALTGTK